MQANKGNRTMRTARLPEVGLIREADLLASGAVPFGRTRLRQMVAAGEFQKPLDLGPRLKPFDAAEVRAWLARTIEAAPRVTRAPVGAGA
jgi:predicted DNA-binding transcriptional regulator AlpA